MTLSCQIPRFLYFSLKYLGGRCSFWSWLLKIRQDFCRVAYFCLTYSSFLMKLHPCPVLLLIFFALKSSIPGIDFSFFKKGVYLISFFCLLFYGITRFWNKYEQQCCGKTTLDVPEWIWLDLPLLLEIDGKSPAFPMWLSIT